MAKNLKLNIKNTQIAQAINLGKLKDKLAKKKEPSSKEEEVSKTATPKAAKGEIEGQPKEEQPRIRARSRSAFAEKGETPALIEAEEESIRETQEVAPVEVETLHPKAEALPKKDKAKGKQKEESQEEEVPVKIQSPEIPLEESLEIFEEEKPLSQEPLKAAIEVPQILPIEESTPAPIAHKAHDEPRVKLGPTGKHISDLLPHKYAAKAKEREALKAEPVVKPSTISEEDKAAAEKAKKPKGKDSIEEITTEQSEFDKKSGKAAKFKEFRDLKPTRRVETTRTFDARDRHGFRDSEEEFSRHRKKRQLKKYQEEATIVRPTQLSIRIPITIKDLASAMKLKSSELIAKMFLHGIVVTLNSILEDETAIQLLGHEFGCEIKIDTSEEERIRITDKSIQEEIDSSSPEELTIRAPIVAFMGHVDHGKTSLIDAIRKSNRAAGEAGAITQHIGAFRCHTPVGDIAILDTPGHEAFSAMRERGAEVTDIVVLVIAGDEGIRQQTLEAIQHAKEAQVTIIVALNKADKPNFNAENVYRQLAEQDLLPEAWGGQIITVNCSAATGEGISTLLEMLAIQAEVLELKANPHMRARGTVLESEMHKGMGAVATVLVQNGTLKCGDALVCNQLWGRVKTMHDEYGKELTEAGPSTPVEITGLSELPEAGEEFIVVKNEREAREIAEVRAQGIKQKSLQLTKKVTLENMFQKASETIQKKIFNVVLRADVQGSLEAIKVALQKIQSQKIDLFIIFAGVGEVSESDVQLAATSKAVIIGFHTQIESHAETLVKQLGVQVKMHDIIYHAIDDVKELMAANLDKIAQEIDKGKAEVKAVFKSSHHGMIAGCYVTEGTINRNHHIRLIRSGEAIWKGTIASLKRVKDDVREVQKGVECGILLNGYNEVREGDVIESYEINYISQEL